MPAPQYQPPRPAAQRWLWPAAAALLVAGGVAAFLFLGSGAGDGEPSTSELFEQMAQEHRDAGCDAEVDFRGELALYIDRFEDPACVFRLMTTAQDLGIDLPDFTDDGGVGELLGTFEGADYVLEADLDRDGVSFAFRGR